MPGIVYFIDMLAYFYLSIAGIMFNAKRINMVWKYLHTRFSWNEICLDITSVNASSFWALAILIFVFMHYIFASPFSVKRIYSSVSIPYKYLHYVWNDKNLNYATNYYH